MKQPNRRCISCGHANKLHSGPWAKATECQIAGCPCEEFQPISVNAKEMAEK